MPLSLILFAAAWVWLGTVHAPAQVPYPPYDYSGNNPPAPTAGQNPAYPGDAPNGPDAQNGPDVSSGPYAPPASSAPTTGITFQTFYNSLAGDGNWIQTGQFGYVWQPNINDPQWAPYTNGHWVYSDAGWTWVSDEPWGWATYHYGRWANLDGIGWCWVPGYTWAPAWVSWRFGDGYVGWAPLPPDSLIGVDYDAGDDSGFHIGGDCDSYYDIGPAWYCFLPIGWIGERDYRGYYVDRYHNYSLINHTTNVTNLNVTRGGGNVFAGASLGGPSLRQVDAASQTPVSRVNLVATDRVGGGAVSGGALSLFAPHVQAAGGSAPSAFHSFGSVRVNRGTDVSHPLLVTSRLSAAAPTSDEIEQARAAQAQAPLDARVATPQNRPATFARPLSTMQPVYPATENDTVRSYSGSATGGTYRPSSNYAAPRTYSSDAGHASSGYSGYHSGGGSGGGHSGGSTQGSGSRSSGH